MPESPDHGLALLTPEEMGAADRLTISAGTPGYQLMQTAGEAVFRLARQALPDAQLVTILCGPGNNGGDGFVAAELLRKAGINVQLGMLGSPDKLSGDAALAHADWQGETLAWNKIDLCRTDIIIDALFGAGLTRALTGEAAQLVEQINACEDALIISVDLPSGLDGRTGQPTGPVIRADHTVSFFRPKPGHFLEPGRTLCGQLHIADIGIPADTTRQLAIRLARNAPPIWRHHYPVLDANDHKYVRGHTLVFSGGEFSTGASRLTAQAALRAGAGLVSIAGDKAALRIHAAHVTAIMLKPCETLEDYDRLLADPRITTIALGPGLGLTELARDLLDLASLSEKSIVVDADGLTLLSRDEKHIFKRLRERSAPCVLTPHEGEFKRLFPHLSDASKVERAREAARRSQSVIVYKGPDTVIAAPDGRALINTNAPPWLATAGSGDTLAGIITGLLSQGMTGFDAAAAGVWLHGEAAKMLGSGLTADDLDEGLKAVLRKQPDFA